MAKKELFAIKPIGKFFISQGAFPISRNKKDFGSMIHAMNIVKTLPAKTLLIFPEGTRKASKKGVKAKTGTVYIAAKTKVPITPIYIEEKRRFFCKIRIIYGKPMMINISKEQIKDKKILRHYSDLLMEEIYSMKDVLNNGR